MLEGLYVAGKINGGEAGDWAARFRSVLAAPDLSPASQIG